jgi:hypothetical protein
VRDSSKPPRKPIRIAGKKVLTEGKFLRFVLASYVDSSGITRNWELFERINCSGIVAIVPVTDEGNVLHQTVQVSCERSSNFLQD